MKIILYLVFILFSLLESALFLQGQANVNYNDVGVIVNINSPASVEIADYFMQKRSVPAINRITVDVPTDEEINDSIFASYRSQVEQYLDTNNLRNSLNYLVTTKGCPLKVKRGADSLGCDASVESEFMLLPPPNNVRIGSCTTFNDLVGGNFFTNPYFLSINKFNRANTNIYLVTRLDAYTVEDVIRLIDRSGPNRYVTKQEALFVLDQAVNFSGNPLNSAFENTTLMLLNRGWAVELNADSVFVTAQQNVLGYASWGSNDEHAHLYSEHARPCNSWIHGSIAETHVSTSGRSFQPGTPYGQSLIADLIKEGVCGAKGYVYEPLAIAIASSDILFQRYTEQNVNGTPHFNLAESYFSASRMIGWMDVVIGDPKTSVTTNPVYNTNGSDYGLQNDSLCQLPVSIHSPRIYSQWHESPSVYPNPSSGRINISGISFSGAFPVRFAVYDLYGRLVQDGSLGLQQEIALDTAVTTGMYMLRIEWNKQVFNRPVSVIR